jgi:N utilization substance protein B
MANRHLSRSVVLQSLFEWDSRGQKDNEIEDIIKRNVQEFAPGVADITFIDSLTKGILAKKTDLAEVIEKAAPEWPLDKISPVDRNVLRLGLYELLFADREEVPAKVAINESIELAKTFGGETSGRFVNGVLGAVYKELGEPGKDAEPIKKKKIEDIPYEKMPIQHLRGGRTCMWEYRAAFEFDWNFDRRKSKPICRNRVARFHRLGFFAPKKIR